MLGKSFAGFALGSALFLLAPAAWAAEKPCLQVGRIYDWQPMPDNRSLVVTDVTRRKFKVTLIGICNDLQWHLRLGFAPFAGSTLSCLDRGDTIIARRTTGLAGDRCPVAKVEAYTPQMERIDAVAVKASKHP